MNRVRIGFGALCGAGVRAAVLTTAAPVSAAPAQESVVANVASGPFHIDVTASRAVDAAPDTATGVFTAHFTLGSATVFTLHGPVTCLDVRGGNVGLFYPITSSSPPLFAQLHSGVFIYLYAAKGAIPARVGFLPVTISSTKNCAPGLALLPVTSGSMTIAP
jgi:hypothetical protein